MCPLAKIQLYDQELVVVVKSKLLYDILVFFKYHTTFSVLINFLFRAVCFADITSVMDLIAQDPYLSTFTFPDLANPSTEPTEVRYKKTRF